MKRTWRIGLWLALVLGLYVLAVVFALDVVSPEPRLGRWYPWFAAAAALALLVLLVSIVRSLLRVEQRVRAEKPGARLARRLVWRFVLLVLPPLLVVYGFALNFLVLTVDAWFNVRLERALDDALELGRRYAGRELADAERQSSALVATLSGTPDARLQQSLDLALDRMDALQIAVLSGQGRVDAVASADPRLLTPPQPGAVMLTQLQSAGRYAALEPIGDRMLLRVLLPLDNGPGDSRLLQALYTLPPEIAGLTRRIEGARFDFERFKFLRGALKLSFVLVLSFVVLLSLLATVLAAVAVARRLVEPIGQLAVATDQVARGRYDVELPPGGSDELGFLLASFAGMTARLGEARDEAAASAAEIDRQRAYLSTVLEHMSSGVLGMDRAGVLRAANAAAAEILARPLDVWLDRPLADLLGADPRLEPLLAPALAHLEHGRREWHSEVQLPGKDQRPLVLMVRGSVPGSEVGGLVLMFEDLTERNRAQRDAAWSEVAERLAHEVKNPLTPIQLAAERLRHRLAGKLDGNDASLVERATDTIVSQVDALKTLVNAFGGYARNPHATAPLVEPQAVDPLVHKVVALYEADPGIDIAFEAGAGEATVRVGDGKLRQLLHNLIKNAREAVPAEREARIRLQTRVDSEADTLQLSVADNGSGLPAGFDRSWFEPYVSGKPGGSGLGLAVVKKIVDEAGGSLQARNRAEGGAEFVLTLPLAGLQRH